MAKIRQDRCRFSVTRWRQVSGTLALSGCELVEGIFKAGVWVGVIIVVVILVGVGALFSRLR